MASRMAWNMRGRASDAPQAAIASALDMQDVAPARQKAAWRDYLELTKPRVVGLMLLCAAVGMVLASPSLAQLATMAFALAGIALVAGSAAAVNHLAEARIDARMARTRNRPVVQGRVTHASGVAFCAITGIAGMLVLYLLVNPLTAWLNLASWVGYGLFYTFYLKRATPQNTVIGGLFGALPPLFGWTAITNTVELEALLLVLIIFVWTPPHFWALALDRKEEYAAADIPVLPVTHGEQVTRRHILAYTVLLVAASVLPYVTGMSRMPYLVGALALGGVFIYWAVALLIGTRADAPKRAFRYSIVYLAALFGLLVADHYLVA